MKYMINELSKIAGISTRTLRYYDEIGLLKPEEINSSGYRVYGEEQVDMLQQILFFKELEVDLKSIKTIISDPGFNVLSALEEHRKKLFAKKEQLEILIDCVDKSITNYKGELIMSDKEKFEGFKQNMLNENGKKYGTEIREMYGDNVVEESNKRFMNMSKEDYNDIEHMGEKIIELLYEAYLTGDASYPLAQEAADLHKQWLTKWWGHYDKDAHDGIARMYVDDERFRNFYDKEQPGTAEFLRDAILIYVANQK